METVPENSIPGLSDSIAKIREDVKSGVENLTEECVSTMADVTRLLMKVFIFLVLICEPKCTPIHGSTEVFEVKGDDVGCVVKNSATLVGTMYTLHAAEIHIDLPTLIEKDKECNMAGKPAVLTRVVDSMTNNLRPTRAVATDVANAVLDGSDPILLGAETLCGLHPVETVSTVSRICAEAQLSFGENKHLT
ncbi:pyruvate kinase [Cucumis melo var. makuwa]|uniref:Pyruvate kinase n=1 Tax=Cucumis melo var. makuwa TaxID=1194695 RepID=A0A5A7VQM2_CUCMM|nr:pyruvate kinase [Cucumis melo var. makuwa]